MSSSTSSSERTSLAARGVSSESRKSSRRSDVSAGGGGCFSPQRSECWPEPRRVARKGPRRRCVRTRKSPSARDSGRSMFPGSEA